jgi:hypothetical protein
MKKTIFSLLLCTFCGYIALYAQETEVNTQTELPKISLKTSIGAFAEYATCLHLSIEARPFKTFGFQTEIGYYSDFLRNKSYNTNTSSFNGLRLGGEARYYFTHKTNQKVQSFIGLSCVTNISKVRASAAVFLLQNGKIVLIDTPIGYQHQRTFYDFVTGVQAFFNARFFLDTSFGFGMVTRQVSNIEVFDKEHVVFNDYQPLQILFPNSNLWTQSSHLDSGAFVNFAANIKIGYRLF